MCKQFQHQTCHQIGSLCRDPYCLPPNTGQLVSLRLGLGRAIGSTVQLGVARGKTGKTQSVRHAVRNGGVACIITDSTGCLPGTSTPCGTLESPTLTLMNSVALLHFIHHLLEHVNHAGEKSLLCLLEILCHRWSRGEACGTAGFI